jgi:hypothetical protein
LELESKVRYIKILLTDIYQVTVFFSHPSIEFMNVIITANELTKIYGEKETSVTALDNINIEF